MANTKSLSREERKATKRTQRKVLTKLYDTMTSKQHKKFRKLEEPIGFKAFLAADAVDNVLQRFAVAYALFPPVAGVDAKVLELVRAFLVGVEQQDGFPEH